MGQKENRVWILSLFVFIMLWNRKLMIILDNIPMSNQVREEDSVSVLSLKREEDAASLWNTPPWVIDLLGRHCPSPCQQNVINAMEKAQGWMGSTHFIKKPNHLKSKMYVFNFLQKWLAIIFPHHCIFFRMEKAIVFVVHFELLEWLIACNLDDSERIFILLNVLF